MPDFVQIIIRTKDLICNISSAIFEVIFSVYSKLTAEETDIQAKIFYVLLFWLGISLLLILISWKTLGHRVVKMLTPNAFDKKQQ